MRYICEDDVDGGIVENPCRKNRLYWGERLLDVGGFIRSFTVRFAKKLISS